MEYRKRKERKTGAQYVQSVQLGRDLYNDTKRYSAKYNIPMAQVIREALNRFLNPEADDFSIMYRELLRAKSERTRIQEATELNTELIFNMVRKMYHYFEVWDAENRDNPTFKADKKLEQFHQEILDAKVKNGLYSERLDRDVKLRAMD